MTLVDKLLRDFNELPEDKQREVVDFVEFLKTKVRKDLGSMMDDVISENYEALRELGK